ncbi:MAG: hypothetical protein HY675_07980 [Chloroflexi bacterium]|nr:hypothetical protein [Chloroflexota bacterium]
MAKKAENHLQTTFIVSKAARMPDGCYFGDAPNPNLGPFVEVYLNEHRQNQQGDDYNYDVLAFDEPLTVGNRRDAINDLHIYWSKKPYQAIRKYVRHYTRPGDLVLDPFCGSGTTALAALLEGRQAIAIDRSPAATFITKNYCTPVDAEELRVVFKELEDKVKSEIDWLYETRCDRCGSKATTAYTVYSQVFQCPRCMTKVPLFDCVEVLELTKDNKPQNINVCPHCYSKGHKEPITARHPKLGSQPVLVSYVCQNNCKPVRGQRRYNDEDANKRGYFERYDLNKLSEIEAKDIPHWYPTVRMLNAPEDQVRWGMLWRPYLEGITRVDQFFTKRNLWGLSLLLEAIKTLPNNAAPFLFAFSGALYNASRMYQQRHAGGGPAKGTYYVPPIFREVAVQTLLSEKVRNLERATRLWSPQQEPVPVLISTQSASSYNSIPEDSIDYIFTDPPYSWKVQYGESNFLWEAWLGFDTRWLDDEVIVNEYRGKSENDWMIMMKQAMSECYRVLKPGHWLSLCYHDTSEGTWAFVQDIMAEVGFLSDRSNTAVFIETGQKAWKQIVADKVNKRDLVISFRKPKRGETMSEIVVATNEDQPTFSEEVRANIRDYLTAHPGATKDRIYDEVVSRLVRAGRMEAHNFEELLRQVAEEIREPVRRDLFENEPPNLFGTHEVGKWYLKMTEIEVMDVAESAKEDLAARSVGEFVAKWLKNHREDGGVHYSDIFEYYIYAIKDKPRRHLQDWLLDYFYKTPDGTYRPAKDDEEAEEKSRARASGTNRRIKHYIGYLQQGVAVPEKELPSDATLAEWIRNCKRSGLYEQGKLLYERGGLNLDSLSEEAQVNVEEDYETCVRMLSRSNDGKQVKKGNERKGSQARLFQ